METFVVAGPLGDRVAFLNFLRGMETPVLIVARRLYGNFLNFLRGMETAHVGRGLRHWWRFLNFLRGMETGIEIRYGLGALAAS